MVLPDGRPAGGGHFVTYAELRVVLPLGHFVTRIGLRGGAPDGRE